MRAHLRIFRDQLRRKLLSRGISCPFCGSSDSTLLYKSPNVHMAFFRDIFAEKVKKCQNCGFVYTNPRLSTRQLEKYYNNNYLLEGLKVPESLEEFLGETYKEIWFSKERDLNLVLGTKPGGRLLDVGCASGTLLWLARQKGFSVSGVEISRQATDFANRVLGLDIFCGQLEDARFNDGEFDAVAMIHSLEHVPEPRRVLREIHRILSDEGALIIVVPNLVGWSAQKEGTRWRWLQPQNHYSHFTPETMAGMAKLEGFEFRLESEEGRYGEEDIRADHDPDEIRDIYASMRGSEIVFVGRKSRADATPVREFASAASRSDLRT